MSSRNTKRLMRDVADFQFLMEPVFLFCTGYADDMSVIDIDVIGPADTPFSGGRFRLEFQIPDDFPISPPQIKCKTPMWHPNISLVGTVCMSLLDIHWKSGVTLVELAEGFRSLLTSPNPLSPMNADAAELLIHEEELYHETAAMWSYIHGGATVTSPPHLNEKLEILTALGMGLNEALTKATENMWNIEPIVNELD